MDQMGIVSERKRQDMKRYDDDLILLEDRIERRLQALTRPSQE
jgi:hypothetical protein